MQGEWIKDISCGWWKQNAKASQRLLTRQPYQVLEAQDGEEAVEYLLFYKGINLLVLECYDAEDGRMGSCQRNP